MMTASTTTAPPAMKSFENERSPPTTKAPLDAEYVESDVVIGKRTWLGANVVVLPGVCSTVHATLLGRHVEDEGETVVEAASPASTPPSAAVVDAGAFDYAADACGYTFGSAIEWTRSWWTLRGGWA